MQTPVDEIRRNSWLFDEFLTETKLRRHFREFSRHVLFWTARTFGDKFLDGVNATRNFERKFVLCGEFSGRKFVVLFILLKKIWLNLWLVTTLCNTPIKFPATIPVSARPILFATMATQVVVSMRLGSCTQMGLDLYFWKDNFKSVGFDKISSPINWPSTRIDKDVKIYNFWPSFL